MPGRGLSPSFFRKCKFPSSFFTPASRPYSLTSTEFVSSLSPSQESRFKDLTHSLSDSTDPSYVWATYTNLIALLGNKPLPLEFHQQVLRRCTPPWRTLRDNLIQGLKAGQRTFIPPDVESRFHSLVNNIRFTGAEPNVDDFNFILSQFASYGHFEGTSKLYKEMKRVGITPNDRTFAYCLRAMAYRLDLPIHKRVRPQTVKHIQSLFKIYAADMKTYNVPMSGRILDLALRIMKETVDLDGLERILRTAYAVDLSNLDRVPLEYSETGKNQPVPFPFTTTALNTTLDTLGMVGSVSKLVQAFEVLTQPLPRAGQHFFNSFESDEEGDFGVAVKVTPPFPTPSALPNTTSYGILLRHLCKAGHHILARHYIIEALRLQHRTSWVLKRRIQSHLARNRPLHFIPRPHFQISRLMLLSVLGECNRDKNFVLMKWLSEKLPDIIKKLKRDLAYHSRVVRRLETSGQAQTEVTQRVSPVHHLFDADIDQTDVSPMDRRRKMEPFDINVHVEVLTRNLKDIESFQERLNINCARASQRIKERLGRRVWQGKDIYLQTEQRRVSVDKDHWRKIVNFRANPPPSSQKPKPLKASGQVLTLPPIFQAFESFGKR